MEKLLAFQCSSQEELINYIKLAVREVIAEYTATAINAPPANELEVLSPAEVCSLLKISRPTLIKLNKDGKLNGKRLGGKIFYQKSEVEKALTTIKRR